MSEHPRAISSSLSLSLSLFLSYYFISLHCELVNLFCIIRAGRSHTRVCVLPFMLTLKTEIPTALPTTAVQYHASTPTTNGTCTGELVLLAYKLKQKWGIVNKDNNAN